MIVLVIHESYTAKIPHLYSGCQVFGDIFLQKKIKKRLLELLFKCDDSCACVFMKAFLPIGVSTRTLSIDLISFKS